MQASASKHNVFKKVWFAIKTTLKFVLLLCLMLGLVVYTNYTVDPGNVFSILKDNPTELQAAQWIMAGNNVDGLGDFYNERLLKRSCVNLMAEPYDTIVMGSSRAALLTSDMLGTDSMFNLFVTGAGIDDVVGFYQLLYEKDLLPETLILVVDPWMLNDTYRDTRFYRSLGDTYFRFVTDRLGYVEDPAIGEDVGEWYLHSTSDRVSFLELDDESRRELLSIPYFQESLRALISPTYTGDGIFISEDLLGTGGLLRADGSWSYPSAYRDAPLETVIHRAELMKASVIIGNDTFPSFGGTKTQLFRDFLSVAAHDGVEVRLLLEPLSPILHDNLLVNAPEGFFEVEPFLYETAAEFGLRITGSFDPALHNLDADAFYDGYHVIPRYLPALIEPLRDDYSG